MDNVIELSKNFVIQRSVLASAKTNFLTELMNTIAESGKKMLVVDNLNEFFGVPNLIAAVNKGDTDTLVVVAEKQGIDISGGDLNLIYAFNQLKVKLVEKATAKLPKYSFAAVPEDWSVESHLNITKTNIGRKDGRNYTIGILTLKKIWINAAKDWAGAGHSAMRFNISAGGYNPTVSFRADRVDVGCQRIKRYELEQMALHMGWDFPEKEQA